ncbi:NACHT domain-containing protein [Limnoraphis robusta]|uniref:NACHT domain-containing protein n=1 Tax=Limnoraphis robusta TaxID=1118279 RepID=UPI002B21E3FF|nr:pentapeptide repeat-containing protein [Limnoraphis robusta]MEA5496136.1 pentapeptide repeat-containing protein [Limnoraphis robusta BA-68 BA1]
MAGKLWRKIWTVLNTDIELSLTGTVSAGVEGGKAVFELAKALQENKNAKELAPIIENFDSLLDVLNSPLGKVAGTALPFLPIATGILTYIAEQTRSEPSLADSVQLVSQVAYLESLRVFLKEHPKLKLAENTASSQLAKKIKKLGETLEVDGKEINFDDQEARKTLICFHDSPLAKVFNAILVERFQESGLDENTAKITTERISRNTHRYMKEAVAEVRDSAKKLAGIYGDGWLKDIETYHSIDQYLKEVIATKPEEKVFDENFNFRQIYVPMNVKPVKSDGEVIEEDSKPENIEYWAKTTLLDDSKKGQVLFIQGGPGRGKSVFCRMFSDWVRRELHPIYTPILIRLRDIKSFSNDINETLATVIDRDFTRIDRGWLTDSNTRFLFLLDGFDELLLERGKGNDLKFFLDQVADFQKRCSKNNEQGHRVLITGRPLALYGIERLMPTNLERVEIIPMDDTIQQQWLEKWKTVVNSDPTIAVKKTDKFRQFLHDNRCPQQAKDLAKEPLLLYLLAVLHRDDQLHIDMFKKANVGQAKILIYEQALEWVLNKQRTEDGRNLNPELTDLEPEDLRSLLAEAGLCVVQSGREYASIKMIENRLEEENEAAKALIEKARQTGSDEALKNALAAFYLKSGKADNSVEFFHKSFGEFLCAERMAETLEEFTFKSKKRGKTYEMPKKELEWEIYDLFGYGNLTAEIVEYLMALLMKKSIKNEIDFAVLFERLHEFYLRWCNGDFIELWDASEEMLPLKKARQLQQQDIKRGQRQVDIYTGLNVMILLFELHRYGQSKEELKEKLHFYPCGQRGSEEFDEERLLKIIGYADSLNLYAFSSIVGQFLSGADLSGAYLSAANLCGANLSDAILSDADLSRAILSDADLISADLSGAYLSAAELISADLISADLSGVNLSDANLSGAILSDADLRSANLIAADLSSADLSSANLRSANLSDIRWDSDTKWSNVVGLEEAKNVPEELKQQSEFEGSENPFSSEELEGLSEEEE